MLAGLEGWGQDKRRTAAIQAELHNVTRLLAYAQAGDPKAEMPKMLTESHFLPRRVRRRPVAEKTATTKRKLASVLNNLCGY